MVVIKTSASSAKRRETIPIIGREGTIDIIRFIKRNRLGAYLGEIQRNIPLSRQTIKNRLDELKEFGIIESVPDIVVSEPNAPSRLVVRYEINIEFEWVLDLLFKDE